MRLHSPPAGGQAKPRTLARRCGAGLTALTLAALTIAADPAPTPAGAQTGGQIIPCPGSPWGNGWFNTWGNGQAGAVNCSQQDNHIVIDVYNSQGLRTQGAIDLWYGTQCDLVTGIQPSPGLPFKLRMRNREWVDRTQPGCGTWGLPITTDAAYWRQAWVASGTTRAFGCRVLANRTCPNQEGWADLRVNGTNNGPYTMFGLHGSGAGTDAANFSTEISVYLR